MKNLLIALVVCGLASIPAYGLDLLETYDLGLSNDPKVLQSEAKRNAALKNKPIGLARLLPSVVVNGDISGARTDTGKSPILVQANTNYTYWQSNFNLRLTQPLFHYDSWVQYWQADHKIAQAEATLAAEYQDLAVRVAERYFEVLFAEENIDFIAIELKSLELQLSQVKERLAMGFATVVDRDEVQAQFDKVSADAILADQKLNDAREALREIIGPVDVALVRVPDRLSLARPEPADMEIWRNTAQQSNLNIIAATSAAAVAKETIDLYFSGHLPTLDLVGQKQLSNNNRPPIPLDYDQSSVGLFVNVPIFSGGGVNAQVEQARDLYEEAQHEVDKQRRAAERQVKDSFRGVLTAIGRAGALETALKSAQSALDAAQTGYQVGTRTVVDVLIEQTKFFEIRRDYARSRYDYLVNGLRLKQAAGTLAREDMEAVNRLISPGRRGAGAPDAASESPSGKGRGSRRAASSVSAGDGRFQSPVDPKAARCSEAAC